MLKLLSDPLKRILFFRGTSPKTIANILTDITRITQLPKNKKKEVEIVICSSGGNCESAIAFYDMVRLMNIHLSTIGTGAVESSAVIIFLAAEKERRFITENSILFFHEVSLSEGKEINMSHKDFGTLPADLQEGIVRAQENTIRIISEQTGLKPKKILKWMKKKKYLNAQEAVRYGFACEVVPN
jgi:ATP-dependent Clp protease protease subunit